MTHPEPTIEVRRQWNNWKHAIYRFAEVEGLHWSRISGGVMRRANRWYIHGYVMCDRMLTGHLAHSCKHGEGPHRIKVCIVMKDNKAIWPLILEKVGQPNPNKPPRKRKKRGHGGVKN